MYSDIRHGRGKVSTRTNDIERINEFNEFKSSFLRILSHEIRTPMNSIIGFTDLLNEDGFSRHDKALFINTIKDSSINLLNVIEELIYLADIETNQIKPVESICSLSHLFTELLISCESIKQKRKKNDINFQINNNILKNNLTIFTDTKRLRKILMILLDNAVKYTENGNIDFGYIVRDNESILFYVIDTGIGIPFENQENVFLEFGSTEKTASVFKNGLGVGLTIAKGIIEILGGKIWFQSMPNEGTTFYFTIPIKMEPHNKTKSSSCSLLI